MLVAPLEVDEKTEGGIILPDERRDAESAASVVACVIKQGSSAYKDIKKFPDGPWCENGDWVLIPSYAGTRILVQGMQFRIINDDTVHAVVEDPRGVSRA
jgi:co-chaperonin GroES (HSP10)